MHGTEEDTFNKLRRPAFREMLEMVGEEYYRGKFSDSEWDNHLKNFLRAHYWDYNEYISLWRVLV